MQEVLHWAISYVCRMCFNTANIWRNLICFARVNLIGAGLPSKAVQGVFSWSFCIFSANFRAPLSKKEQNSSTPSQPPGRLLNKKKKSSKFRGIRVRAGGWQSHTERHTMPAPSRAPEFNEISCFFFYFCPLVATTRSTRPKIKK